MFLIFISPNQMEKKILLLKSYIVKLPCWILLTFWINLFDDLKSNLKIHCSSTFNIIIQVRKIRKMS